jgi:hypothetical protein
MAALVIGGVTIPGVVAARRTVVEAVERERAYDNTMLATQIATSKWEVQVEVSHVTAAELSAIAGALAGTPPLSVTGDLTGGISCVAEVHSHEPVLGILPLRYNLSFTLYQI